MQDRSIRRAAALLLVMSSGLAIAGSASAQVRFKTGADQALVQMGATELSQARAALTGQHVVVQFSSTPTQEQRAAIEASGIRLLSPLGDSAYFAMLTPAVAGRGAAAAGAADAGAEMTPLSIRAVRTEWKLHPMIARGEVPTWAVVSGPEADPVVGAYMALHDDQQLNEAAMELVRSVGGQVRDLMVSVNGLVIEAPYSKLRAIAADDRVMWIEPALPKLSDLNAENRVLTGANTAQSAPYNLNGAGVKVFVYDGGTARATHSDFQGRLTTFDSSGLSNHATHVAGTIGGAGVTVANNRGMAPGCTLLSSGFEYSGSGTFLYTNPGDIEADFATAVSQNAAVSNASIGTNTESNGFDCSFQGQYGLTDRLIDQIAKGSAGAPIIMVWAAGNERQGTRCNIEGFGSYYSVAPPSGAKNHIPVAAVNANDDSMTSFSSWGPTDDGRMVPVISAPGCQSGGDGGVTSCGSSSDTAYASMCGTSMASPTVTGLVTLFLQDYRAQYPATPDPTGATVKAILAHTAVDRGNVGPDYQFGYGSVRVIPAIDLMRSGLFSTSSATQSTRNIYRFTVAPGTPELKYTLTWDDVAATPNAALTLVNNLDLVLVDPSGNEYNAWTLNPADPSAAAVRTVANTLDNIEQVFVASPVSGQWRLEVRGTNVAQGPQAYSLVGLPSNSTHTQFALGIQTQVASPLPPGQPITLDVLLSATGESIVANSATFNYRFDPSDPFTSVPLTPTTPNHYDAILPAGQCGETVEYFVQAEGTDSGVVNSPSLGAAAPVSRTVDVFTTIVNETFQAANGWAESSNPQLSSASGRWDRGTPNPSFTRGEPTVDFDGSGQCWVTGNVNQGDVDGGPTILTSPIFDTSGVTNPTVSYARWLSVTDADAMVVQISTDGGATWPTTLETITGPAVWTVKNFPVPSSSQFRIRFSVADVPNNSVTEAGIDAFKIIGSACTYSCPADIDRNGTLDLSDYFDFFNAFDASDPLADVDGVPGVDLGDFFAFLNSFDGGCTP